jgi:hypothetical protein
MCLGGDWSLGEEYTFFLFALAVSVIVMID